MEYSRGLHKSAVIIYMIERVIIQVIRRLKANCRLRIASAMTLCSLLYGLPPTYAASNLFEPGSYEQLARAEQVFFGKPNTTNSYFRRLDLLEVGIFGRVRSGSAEKRFDRISNALGLDAMNYGTARPPGDLTKGLANHESQENAANAEMSTLPVTSAVSGSESKLDSQSETSLSAAKHADLKSTSVGNIQEQQDSSNVASKSDFAAKPSISAAFNSASGATSNLANKVPTNAMKAKAAPAVKPGRSAILSKETPKLEPIAHKATDNADRRIKRSVPGTPTEIAHDKTKEVEELFKKGISDFREKHYADAQICFKKILAIDPRNVDAYYNLGSLSETKHDYVDALTYYRAALATKPADSDFKSAVHAMEDELRKQHGVTVTASEHRSTNSTDATSFINDDGKNNSKHDLAKNSGRGSGTSGSHIADVGSSTSHVADVGSTSAPEVKVGGQQAPIIDISSTDAPVLPAQRIDDKTFSLQTAQNGALTPFTPMNGLQSPYQGVPIYGVPSTLSGNIPSNNNISQNPPNNSTRGTFNSILKIGANAALQGSGLHCPICRVLGGLH